MFLQSSLIFVLSSISLCFGQDGTPTVTALEDALGVMAIVPTTTGQIGINPVDIPPPESLYVRFILQLVLSLHSSKLRKNWSGFGLPY